MYSQPLETFDEEIILSLAKRHPYSQEVVEKIYRYLDRSTDKTILIMRFAIISVRDPLDLMIYIK